MLRIIGGDRTLPIAAQIAQDQPEMPAEFGRDAMPDDMGLRIAVQHEHGRPLAADAGKDLRAARREALRLETGEEVSQILRHRRSPTPLP
jgi:hypothetical protein